MLNGGSIVLTNNNRNIKEDNNNTDNHDVQEYCIMLLNLQSECKKIVGLIYGST